MLTLLSPSKYSPLEALHRSERVFHYPKQNWNSSDAFQRFRRFLFNSLTSANSIAPGFCHQSWPSKTKGSRSTSNRSFCSRHAFSQDIFSSSMSKHGTNLCFTHGIVLVSSRKHNCFERRFPQQKTEFHGSM